MVNYTEVLILMKMWNCSLVSSWLLQILNSNSCDSYFDYLIRTKYVKDKSSVGFLCPVATTSICNICTVGIWILPDICNPGLNKFVFQKVKVKFRSGIQTRNWILNIQQPDFFWPCEYQACIRITPCTPGGMLTKTMLLPGTRWIVKALSWAILNTKWLKNYSKNGLGH